MHHNPGGTDQVVEQANLKYGLRAIAFCGKQKDYLPKDKSSFLMAEAIGVTTYSSFFALHSFFDDVDILSWMMCIRVKTI